MTPWPLLYRVLVAVPMTLGARVLAPFAPKVRRGLRGRSMQVLPVARQPGDTAFRVHVHASSVGEFEQAKPIIESLRRQPEQYYITASFYSPSGYDQQHAYSQIDAAFFLPEDRRDAVRRFLDRLAPDLIIVMRYDLWPELMMQARKRGTPSALVCATLRADSFRFLPFARGFFTWLYSHLSVIDCVSRDDARSFEILAPEVPREISGDTRYDRVVERAETYALPSADLPINRTAFGDDIVVVAGSTWPRDEEIVSVMAARAGVRLIVVPHEPTPDHVAAARARFEGGVLLSDVTRGQSLPDRVPLIVDTTGVLLALYALADIAYVGGGFGAGVHSVLEPAAHGVPVVSGPRIERSRDALAMHAASLLDVIATADELRAAIDRLLDDAAARAVRSDRTRAFLRERAGATARIVGALRRHRLLPVNQS